MNKVTVLTQGYKLPLNAGTALWRQRTVQNSVNPRHTTVMVPLNFITTLTNCQKQKKNML